MTTPPDQIPHQPSEDVAAWMRGKTLADLRAIEVFPPCALCKGLKTFEGAPCAVCDATGIARVPRQFVPEVLRWRGADGAVKEEPITFAIPEEDDYLRATRDAVKHVAMLYKGETIKTPDQAREYVGAARFESLDSAALVALCVRSPKAPYGQIYMLHVLLKTHLPSTVADAFTRLDLLFKLYKVTVSELTEMQFWTGASEIARVRNIGFFGALDHALQVPFIVRLAAELAKCRIELSGSGSSTRSTPE